MRAIHAPKTRGRAALPAAPPGPADGARAPRERPRLVVFRSLKHIYAQLVDDDRGVTLLGVTDASEGIDVEGTGKVGAGQGGRASCSRRRPRRRASPRSCSTGRLPVPRSRAGGRRRRARRRIGVLAWLTRPTESRPAKPTETRPAPSERPPAPSGRGGRGGRGGGERGGDAAARGGTAATASTRSDHVENVIAINRVAKVVKGGRRFSFNALVAVGDGKGQGRHRDRQGQRGVRGGPQGGRRRQAEHGRAAARPAPRSRTRSIGQHGAGRVLLKPAATGTGVIAGGPVRAVLECAGITDILTKSLGLHQPAQHGAGDDGRAHPPRVRPPGGARAGHRGGPDRVQAAAGGLTHGTQSSGRPSGPRVPRRNHPRRGRRSTAGGEADPVRHRARGDHAADTRAHSGLRHHQQTVELTNTASIRGMLYKVRHLVEVTPAQES